MADNTLSFFIGVMCGLGLAIAVFLTLSASPKTARNNIISESCVDNKIVLRGDGWRAWRIDYTNKPERC